MLVHNEYNATQNIMLLDLKKMASSTSKMEAEADDDFRLLAQSYTGAHGLSAAGVPSSASR